MLSTIAPSSHLVSQNTSFLASNGAMCPATPYAPRVKQRKKPKQARTQEPRQSFPACTLYGMYVQVPVFQRGNQVLYNGAVAVVDRQEQEGWLWLYRPGDSERFRVWPYSVQEL